MIQLSIRKGSTFRWTLRPETAAQKYIPITAITMTETGVRITAAAHGMVEGWRCRVTRCKGLTRLNTVDEDHPRAADYFQATVIDANTVGINTQNTTGDRAYTGGGILQYGVPMDLAGCSVRAQIRPSAKSASLLLDLGPYITVDVDNFRIDFAVPESVTALIHGSQGVLGVEIEDSAPVPLIMSLPTIPIVFEQEVVRDE